MADAPSQGEIQRYLQKIDPYQLEEMVGSLYRAQGYETTVRNGSGDRGIDVEAVAEKPFEHKVLIQVKRYSDNNKIGSDGVRNYATLYQQVPDVDIVVIITTSDFTEEAMQLATDLSVKLVEGNKLTKQVKEFYHQIPELEIEKVNPGSGDDQDPENKEKQNGSKRDDPEEDSDEELNLASEESREDGNYSDRAERFDKEFDNLR